jgi:hypothetical protein
VGTAHNGALFQTYRNTADGFSIFFPGGWKRTATAHHTRFGRFGDVETILVKPRKHAVTLTAARSVLSNLQKAGTATHVVPAHAVALAPHRTAFVIGYRMEGTVAGKPTMLFVQRYFFSTSGKFATLILSSPLAVNNTAAYRLIAASFRWI